MNLLQCIALLTNENQQIADRAKASLVLSANELIPQGVPKFKEIRLHPPIVKLSEEHGNEAIAGALFCLVYDFCQSVNVVRNMNRSQMIEAAAFLLAECGNFRIEDYVMMFTLAKRGQLVKILDRVDVQVIGQLLDAYWAIRDAAGKSEQEKEVLRVENEINSKTVTFIPEISKGFQMWLEQLPEDEEKPIDKTSVENYARIHNIDTKEMLKQFGHGK